MTGFFDIKSPNWLGGTNVHNTLALIGIAFLVYKTAKELALVTGTLRYLDLK